MSADSIAGLAMHSQSSSPRHSEDDGVARVKLMCSYGGRIMMRPHDSQLRYIGGDTRMLVISRSISYADLCARLTKICGGRSVLPKYKLPYEDYDALVSLICDEDLDTMLEEYDRLNAREAPSRLRIFLFPKMNPNLSLIPKALSFDQEQTFLDALNNSIQQQQNQQQQDQVVLEGLPAQEEVIIDVSGASASSSGSSVVQKIMEADSALQSELPPISTSNPRALAPIQQPTALMEASILSSIIAATEPEAMPKLMQPVLIPKNILPQAIQNPMLIPPMSIQPQILPPRGPKPRLNSPEGIKEKNKLDIPSNSGSPKKIESKSTGKLEIQSPVSAAAEATESVRFGDPRDEEASAQPPLRDESDQGSPVSSINPKEMSLNVFMEQQKLQEAQEQLKFMQIKQEEEMDKLFGGQQPEQQPQIVYYQQPQPQPQPYFVDNNMVYYVADTTQLPYIQRPMHVNPSTPMQMIQRGGSGPLLARQQAPLQRQFSAAYGEQLQKQQQQQQQQQVPRMIFPANRTGPGAQSPSRFRDKSLVTTTAGIPVTQFEGVMPPNIQQHEAVARPQAYELDSGNVKPALRPQQQNQQQIPHSSIFSRFAFYGT